MDGFKYDFLLQMYLFSHSHFINLYEDNAKIIHHIEDDKN